MRLLILTFIFLAHLFTAAQSQSLTRDQIVGSLLMMGFDGKVPSDPGAQQIMTMLKDRQIGAVLTLGRNFGPDNQAKQLGQALQAASPDSLPVLVGIDQEGGLIQRLGPKQGWKAMKSPADVAASMSVEEAGAMYGRVACVLQSWGYTFNLGPVVDLGSEPNNPIITRLGRAFSDRPETVVAYAAGAVKNSQRCGVLTALKHFPGHGSGYCQGC